MKVRDDAGAIDHFHLFLYITCSSKYNLALRLLLALKRNVITLRGNH